MFLSLLNSAHLLTVKRRGEMRSIFGSKSKLEGTVPSEFLVEVQLIKQTREYTAEVVKYMERMVRTAISSNAPTSKDLGQQKIVAIQQDELQKLSRTCEGLMHYFYEQRYYYVLKTTSEIATQLSKRQKEMIQGIYERAMLPIKVWVEEDYPRFIHDLQKLHKLKKERDSAVMANKSKPSPQKEYKAAGLQAQLEQMANISRVDMEKARKIRKHHANCFKLMATMHHKYSQCVLVEIEKAQTLLVRQLADLDDKEQKEQTIKAEVSTKKTARDQGSKDSKDSKDSKQ